MPRDLESLELEKVPKSELKEPTSKRYIFIKLAAVLTGVLFVVGRVLEVPD